MRGVCQQFSMKAKANNNSSISIRGISISFDQILARTIDLTMGLKKLVKPRTRAKFGEGSRKGVTCMNEQDEVNSRTLTAGKKTYFFDIKESKNGKLYLLITESWFKDEESKNPERNSILVFPEQAKDFALTAVIMLDKITAP